MTAIFPPESDATLEEAHQSTESTSAAIAAVVVAPRLPLTAGITAVIAPSFFREEEGGKVVMKEMTHVAKDQA